MANLLRDFSPPVSLLLSLSLSFSFFLFPSLSFSLYLYLVSVIVLRGNLPRFFRLEPQIMLVWLVWLLGDIVIRQELGLGRLEDHLALGEDEREQ